MDRRLPRDDARIPSVMSDSLSWTVVEVDGDSMEPMLSTGDHFINLTTRVGQCPPPRGSS